MEHNTKSGSIDRDEHKEQDERTEHAKREYFQTNPETKAYEDVIQFYVNGETVSIDDSKLPKNIADIVRKRDGREIL
jgi:hypothetical protein